MQWEHFGEWWEVTGLQWEVKNGKWENGKWENLTLKLCFGGVKKFFIDFDFLLVSIIYI